MARDNWTLVPDTTTLVTEVVTEFTITVKADAGGVMPERFRTECNINNIRRVVFDNSTYKYRPGSFHFIVYRLGLNDSTHHPVLDLRAFEARIV
jgi:hypothetical protein